MCKLYKTVTYATIKLEEEAYVDKQTYSLFSFL